MNPDKLCVTCQHSFYNNKWYCEMPNSEENYCKCHGKPYWRQRWRYDPDFLPEFIKEEEMRI